MYQFAIPRPQAYARAHVAAADHVPQVPDAQHVHDAVHHRVHGGGRGGGREARAGGVPQQLQHGHGAEEDVELRHEAHETLQLARGERLGRVARGGRPLRNTSSTRNEGEGEMDDDETMATHAAPRGSRRQSRAPTAPRKRCAPR